MFYDKNKPEPYLKIDDDKAPSGYDHIMKKIIISCGVVLGIAAILLAILLVQNSNEQQDLLTVLSLEETAVRHVKEMMEAGFLIDPNTVESIQQVEINDITLVLVQYSGHRIKGEVELCEMVLETQKTILNKWKARSGAGLCHKINDPSNIIPITVVSSYGTSTILDRGYSTAFGYLRNEQITRVMVTWEDGLVQPASVSARTYLTAREGGFYVAKIETYNNLGENVYTSQIIPAQDDPTNR